MPNRKKTGCFTQKVIEALKLDIPAGTPIYVAPTNLNHMTTSHPKDFGKYGHVIADIIANPDYAETGKHIEKGM